MPFSYFEQLSQTPTKFINLEAWIEMNGITTRMYSELARENLQMMNELMQCSVENLQGFSHARGLEEGFSVVSKGIAKATPPVLQHTQRMLDTLLGTASEYSHLFEEGTQKMSKVVEKGYKDIHHDAKR